MSADRAEKYFAKTVLTPQKETSSRLILISSTEDGVARKDRFRLERVLGQGAFGRVYLGFDNELQRQVAIKVPTKSRFLTPEDLLTYLTEARMVAKLDHPNIVPVYDMGRTQDGSVYVVSKFVEGETLEERIRTSRPSIPDSVRLVVTIARALQHAHDRNVIHRDVKPANILIDEESNVPHVTDFGLAIRAEDYLQQHAIAGTPSYMSPEQASGKGRRLDGRSDVFSLGVVLYELLTGANPFQGGSRAATLKKVQSFTPRPPCDVAGDVPAELSRICSKALSHRISQRYAKASDFATDLEQWLQPSWSKRQTRLVVAASSILAILVCCVMALALGYQRARQEAIHQKELVEILRKFPLTLKAQNNSESPEDLRASFQDAFRELEESHSLPPGSLETELPAIENAAAVAGVLGTLDRALLKLLQHNYQDSEALADEANSEQQSRNDPDRELLLRGYLTAGWAASGGVYFGRAAEHFERAVSIAVQGHESSMIKQIENLVTFAKSSVARERELFPHSITSPYPGGLVTTNNDVYGVIEGSGKPNLLVRALAENEAWWVQPIVEGTHPAGNFRGTGFFGNSATANGTEFEVMVFTFDKDSDAESLQVGSSMVEIPASTRKSRAVKVILQNP